MHYRTLFQATTKQSSRFRRTFIVSCRDWQARKASAKGQKRLYVKRRTFCTSAMDPLNSHLISVGAHNLRVNGWLWAQETPGLSTQKRPEKSIGVWSPLGSSPCGYPYNPWSQSK